MTDPSFAQSADTSSAAGHPRFRLRLDNDKLRGRVTDFCSTDDYIVMTLDDGKIHVFGNGEKPKVLDSQSKAVWSAAVWGKTLVSGDREGDVRVWDLDSEQQLHKLTGHTATVRRIKISDANTAISASRDGTLRIWNIAEGCCRHVLEGHTASVRSLAFSGDLIVSGCDDETARVWSITQGRCLHLLQGHQEGIFVVAFDGKHIATGSIDKSIRIWSPETGECMAVLRAHKALVSRLELQDGVLTSAAADGTISTSSLKGLELSSSPNYTISGHGNSITSLQVKDGRIYSGGSDGLVKVWNAQDGTLVAQIGQKVEAVYNVLSRDDEVIVAVARDGHCLIEVSAPIAIYEPQLIATNTHHLHKLDPGYFSREAFINYPARQVFYYTSPN
ncbi:WD40-repeat-containing domain protein [Lophiotrema nucula]|uniref:WD40-repeat-containing domain protein n=1 Tax=Lophiotrema nucula TaxID=690887 RepID=A0A6A5YJQ6_9PLEO|nr:WD40-repeat-containing domain protein [Lophiotrema nucula]